MNSGSSLSVKITTNSLVWLFCRIENITYFLHKSIKKRPGKVVNFPIHPQNNHSQMSVFALIDDLLSVYLSVCAGYALLVTVSF